MTRPITPLISRRRALSLLGSAAGLVAAPALAASPQCPRVPPVPTVTPPHPGPALGDLARAKGLTFGVEAGLASMKEYGANIYDPAYLQLILNEKPDYLAFGGQFIFSNVATDPPHGDHLSLTNSAYNVTNTWFIANDISPKLQAAHVGARADALIWDDEQARQPWLRPIPRGASSDRAKNRDLDWNIARAEDYLRIAFDKFDELSAAAPGFMKIVSLVNEPLDPWVVPGRMAYRGTVFTPPGVVLDEHAGVAPYICDLYRLAGKLRGPRTKTTPTIIVNLAGTEPDQDGVLMREGSLRLLKMMRAEGLPFEGVGLEAHLQPQMMNDPERPDWSAFGAFLDEVADLGLDIHLTELDVFDFEASCNGRAGRTEESDALVAHYYESFLTRSLQCKAVKSVCLWDLSDRYSFYRLFDVDTWFGYDRLPKGQRPDSWPKCAAMPASPTEIPCPRPNAYDDRYHAKSARAAIARALTAAPART
jgi:endo-1,4-beta-xylanase